MDGFDFSTSSMLTEDEEMDDTEKMSIVDIQAVMLENERLQELNSQLQTTLESTKLQLKQALDSSSTVNAMGEEIQQLRQQLMQANNEKERAISQLSAFSPENSLVADNSLLNNISDQNQSKKIQKYKEEIKRLSRENDEQNQTIEALQESQKKKQKYKDSIKSIANQLKQAKERIEELEDANQKLDTAQKTLQQNNEHLSNQLNASNAFKDETEIKCKSINAELSKTQRAYDIIKRQIEAQSEEISRLNKERQDMFELLNKQVSYLSAYESIMSDLTNQNDLLARKLKASKLINDEKSNLSESEIPFEGELRSKCLKILMIEQYTPSHHIQMILNEANQFIKQQADQLAAASKEAEESQTQLGVERNGAKKYREMMRSLLKELKNIAILDDKINNLAFCDVDTQFIDFVSQQISVVDPLISEIEFGSNEKAASPNKSSIIFALPNSPSYNSNYSQQQNESIPLNFFSSDDQNQKKQVILKEIKPNDEAFSLFASQFLLNTVLKRKIQKLSDSVIKKDEMERIVQALNGNDISDLPKILESLKEQITKIRLTRKREHGLYKKMQQDMLAKNKSENDLKIKVDQLQIQNENLTNECNLMKVKLQVSSNEAILKQSQSFEVSAPSLDQADATTLLNELNKKREEVSKLKAFVKNLQNEMGQIQKQFAKESKRNESDLIQQVQELQETLQNLNEINLNLRRKYKKMKKMFQKKFEDSAQEYQKKIDESRQSFEDATTTMKEKQKQSKDMTQKLLQSLNESENVKQKYQTENVDLQMEIKNLQLKLSKLQEDFSKERQMLKGQLSALQLTCDTKIQEITRSIKQATQAEKERLFSIMVNSLSGVYKIDFSQFDEDSYVSLIEQLKKDIEKLRYFQNEIQFT